MTLFESPPRLMVPDDRHIGVTHPENSKGPIMRRKNAALVAATIGGLGVGALLAGPQFASAATSGGTDSTAPGAGTQPTTGHARTGKGTSIESGQMAVAAKTLGLSDADLSAALKGGKTLAQLAADKGISVDTLVTAMVDDMKAKATAAVTAGTITQTQVDKELADEPAETTAKVNGAFKGGHGGRRGAGVESGQMSVAATTLGLSDADLRTALKGGKTLAQIATDKGVSVDALVTAMVNDVKAKVTAGLANGTITQGKADAELAEEPAETTTKVNNTFTANAGGAHGGRHTGGKSKAPVTPPTAGGTTSA